MKMNKTTLNSSKFDEIQFSIDESNSVNADFNNENYFINYIDESMMNIDEKSFERKHLTGHVETERSFLEILELSEEIFTNNDVQREFECIFHEFDPNVEMFYSSENRRCTLIFDDSILARRVCHFMNGKEFHREKLQIRFVDENLSSIKYLKLPNQERIFMESPPTTPPIAWKAEREQFPNINTELFFALSKLQLKEPVEILSRENHRPAIVIHPCSDTSDDESNHSNEKLKFPTIDAKIRSTSSQDKIFMPGEHLMRRIEGDGDRIL